ncbi:cytochrome C [Shewanella sp. Choline-02u-19]|jgi:nitric oxide reductase subunit C|uniref:c-type cytochrome n=1 Tax=unclassified Shewanella TaxID=196818 RepID=UPI000C34B13E|nr:MULTISPECIES: cytochrome c [unclassified Shewanella]PKG56461.1 cytochrome C [Shewanella sp. GutDb-MelDb]PKG76640.1 cytochrome C [Shewanella sp. GutCb]PKH54603.1 cytochrome C [Shewanella sp. Bg11-22]PKI28661.1 cytochrome C [Shewanella sp. Choline-02u-19]
MSDTFTKGMARNIYYGGSVFFLLLFAGLAMHTTREMPKSDHRENLTEAVANGKAIWEDNNCIGCHTLLGEGAYYAPELGNVYYRRGGGDLDAFKGFMQSWMQIQPLGVPGRRQMPQFNLTEQQVNDLAEFLKFTAEIDVNSWPPNIEG